MVQMFREVLFTRRSHVELHFRGNIFRFRLFKPFSDEIQDYWSHYAVITRYLTVHSIFQLLDNILRLRNNLTERG